MDTTASKKIKKRRLFCRGAEGVQEPQVEGPGKGAPRLCIPVWRDGVAAFLQWKGCFASQVKGKMVKKWIFLHFMKNVVIPELRFQGLRKILKIDEMAFGQSWSISQK